MEKKPGTIATMGQNGECEEVLSWYRDQEMSSPASLYAGKSDLDAHQQEGILWVGETGLLM